MKWKKTIAAITAAMLAMSAINLSGIAAEETLLSDNSSVQGYTVANPTGGFIKPAGKRISDEESEKAQQLVEINSEKLAGSGSVRRRARAAAADDYNHSSDYYYEKMAGNVGAQSLYNEMVEACNSVLASSADLEGKTFNYSDGTSEVAYLVGSFNYANKNLTKEQAIQVRNAVYYSNPQFFFLSSSYFWDSSEIYIDVQEGFEKGSVRSGYQSKIKSVTDECMPLIEECATDLEKEMLIAELLCNYITYNYDDMDAPKGQTIAGALGDRLCVCNGYAMAMAYFCNAVGMDSFLVVSTSHAWNAVKINGKYCLVDTTWMDTAIKDQNGNEYPAIDYYWFNKDYPTFTESTKDTKGDHQVDTSTHTGFLQVPDFVNYAECSGEHSWTTNMGVIGFPCLNDYGVFETCENCFMTNAAYINPKVDHDFENGELTSDATGHKSVCAYGCGNDSGVTAHTTSDTYVNTDTENHWKVCTVCEYKIGVEKHNYGDDNMCICGKEKPVCDHTYDDGEITKKATCTEKGEKTFTCTICKETKTEEIDMIAHTEVVLEAKEATCAETGLTEGKKCSVCGTVTVEQEEIPLKDHTPVVSGRVEPTCTEDGMTSGTKCGVCEKILEAAETIPALDHDWEEIAEIPATCTTEGITAGKKCKREGCGATEGLETIAKLPHTEVTDAAVAATCTETGLTEGKHCSVCETVITKQEVIASLGHDWVTDAAVAATCTETGLTEGKHCSRCDETVAQQVIDASGHNFVDGVCTVCDAVEVADCEHIGGDLKKNENEHYKICTVCSARIEAEPHGYGEFEITQAATCTEAGSRTHSCTTCGFVQTEEISALGHSFDDGKCTVCGAADPGYVAPTPEDPEKPVDNNNNYSASTAVNYPTVAPFGYEVKTSEQIVDEVSSVAEGDTAEVNLSGNTTLDKAVLEAVAGKDITVTVKVPGGSYWTINGKDVEKANKVNLGVRMNRRVISKERVEELSGDKKTVQFSLRHKGDFGFTGILNVPVSKLYNGKYANLYYDNNGSFEFMGSSLVTSGRASFAFTHASDYVIVIDDHAHGEDVSSAAGVYGDEAASADGVYVAVIFAAALTGTAIVLKKRKAQ